MAVDKIFDPGETLYIRWFDLVDRNGQPIVGATVSFTVEDLNGVELVASISMPAVGAMPPDDNDYEGALPGTETAKFKRGELADVKMTAVSGPDTAIDRLRIQAR